MWCHFLDISSVKQFWVVWRPHFCPGSCQLGYSVPVSWQLPIWRIGTAVSIDSKLGCGRQYCPTTWSLFLSFWLASWGSPKLKIFAVKFERQQRKLYRRTFAKIVAIRCPLLFFWHLGENLLGEISWKTAVIAVIFQETAATAAKFVRNAGNRVNFVRTTGGFAFFPPLS